MRTSKTLLAAVAAAAVTGCHQPKSPAVTDPAPAIPVRIFIARLESSVSTEEAVGTVRAKLQATIEAKVSGRVEKLSAVPGQRVEKGELLAELDAREIQARLEQMTALRDQSARDADRLRGLLASGAVSRQEFETVESRFRVAGAAVVEAEALLAQTKIVAPFSGVITRKLADVGDLASPGKALLQMEDSASLRLEADVPESLIGQIRPGARLRVAIPALNSDLQGTVTEIAPAADPATRTFPVKLDLPPSPALRAGLFGRVAVPLREEQVLRVPAPAVLARGQLELVFVETNRQARMRIVKTGKRSAEATELISGIEAGERVIANPPPGLRDGQAVEVQP